METLAFDAFSKYDHRELAKAMKFRAAEFQSSGLPYFNFELLQQFGDGVHPPRDRIILYFRGITITLIDAAGTDIRVSISDDLGERLWRIFASLEYVVGGPIPGIQVSQDEAGTSVSAGVLARKISLKSAIKHRFFDAVEKSGRAISEMGINEFVGSYTSPKVDDLIGDGSNAFAAWAEKNTGKSKSEKRKILYGIEKVIADLGLPGFDTGNLIKQSKGWVKKRKK